MASFSKDVFCPCGSGKTYGRCCAPWIEETGVPETAEVLMRSRYTAYALNRAAYLLSTWHSSTRPQQLDLAKTPNWGRLEVLSVEAGGAKDETGRVEFIAHWQDDRRRGELHEISRFVREEGDWRYLGGETGTTITKIGRNEHCPCHSGRKFKRCCGARDT